MCTYKNVFWFLIDGLRPDFLHLDAEPGRQNFIDRILRKGTVLNCVASAGGGTHTCMHAAFTSLLPSFNGAAGWEKEALQDFRQEIFTVADYFQLAGYETFRYMDAALERGCPMSGFRRWEDSGYPIGEFLTHTDLSKGERRDRFVEDVNACTGKKFVYHHCVLLHDLCGAELGTHWSRKGYARNVERAAEGFERLYHEYDISEDDLVIISSDHGVLLDVDYMKASYQGSRHFEQSVNTFFALIGKGISPQVLPGCISALDEAPTLLRMALGTDMPGQGTDRSDYIFRNIYQERACYRETGTMWRVPGSENGLTSDLFYVRDGKWKYVYGEWSAQSEWLIDLETDGDYQVNLKDQHPELKEHYRQMLRERFDGAYDFPYQSPFDFEKKDIVPEFSLILQMDFLHEDTIESILDMSGPYYEVIMPRCEVSEQFQSNYKVRLFDTPDRAETCARGEWLVYLTENGLYSEYFLSDLYRYIRHHRREHIRITGEHYTAVRRQELSDFSGRTLYEAKQVRAVRRTCEDCEKDRYILFGCGWIGKRAIYDYFGKRSVFCFVDNNSALTGKTICGKAVISFDKLMELHQNHTIVLTVSHKNAREIGAQLEQAGIHDYFLFTEYYRSNRESCWEDEYRLLRPGEKV